MMYAVDETKLINIADSIRAKLGISDPLEIDEFPLAIDDIPTGDPNIKSGSFTLNADSKLFDMEHNCGFVPDMFIFFTPNNLTTQKTMLMIMSFNRLGLWRNGYTNISVYRGTSATSYSIMSLQNTTYGIKVLDSTKATIAGTDKDTVWKAGTYNWIAIKVND